jgi:hypothetical protein
LTAVTLTKSHNDQGGKVHNGVGRSWRHQAGRHFAGAAEAGTLGDVWWRTATHDGSDTIGEGGD